MKYIKYKKGYKYQLVADYKCYVDIKSLEDIATYYISLTTEGELTIKRGYAWDGPSGPTFDTKNFMRGSLVHDVIYQLIRMGLLDPECRELADIELRKICLKDGMSKIRVSWVYAGVRWGAGFAAKAKNRKKVFSAP